MNKINKVDLLNKIDFGDIDGLYDPNLNQYFIDVQYKESLLHGDKFFVIGRKGTGKSALYNWLHSIQSEEGIIVSNMSFSDFPFERLLSLSDDNFMKPNQYQSIWKHIILLELAKIIVSDTQSDAADEGWRELLDYIKNRGVNLSDLHREITRYIDKYDSRLGYKESFLGYGTSKEIENRWGLSNITSLNNRLKEVICDYLKRHQTCQYIIQFDQLDDSYTSYVNRDEYLQCIQSLFKTIYQLNQNFKLQCINVKIIAYLRSDIYTQFNRHDAESSRWDQFVLKLNWAIINKIDWPTCNLLKLINARIKYSLPELCTEPSPFSFIFNNEEIGLKSPTKRRTEDIFKYIVHRTFQRPRDLIQFCKKIQKESEDSQKINGQTIKAAEKEFSLWLLGEVENEIAPIISDTESLYELLRQLGRNDYTIKQFRDNYKQYQTHFPTANAEDMLRLLYNWGVIVNVKSINVKERRITEWFSVIRNERSVFNRDLNIRTHPGFYEGLHTSKFLQR